MRKLKFLLLALAATISMGAWAQKDVTSTYITNATLSSLDGWTNNNFNTPKQGNYTVGYASEAYAGWDALEKTSYSLTQKITLPKGNYRLVNYSFYREEGNANSNPEISRAFLKAGEKKVAIKTLGSIKPAGYANNQAEGANCFDSKMYRNTIDFNIDTDGTEIEIGLYGTFEKLKSWCIAGMFELWDLDAEASESEPADMTYLITNPGFEYRDATGWTSTGNGGGYAAGDAFAKSGIGFAEKWQSGDKRGLGNGTFYQEISLPAGLYEVKVKASNLEQYNGDAGGTGMFLVANDAETEIGAFNTYSAKTKVTTGKLKLGIKLNGATGNWIAFDRFELNYLGVDLDDLKSTLASVIADAEALYSSKMAADVLQALKDKVTEAESVEQKASAIKAITVELQNAIAAANKSIADYEALKKAYTLAETLYKASADGATDFNTAISIAKNGYTDANVDGAEATAAMKAAIETYLSANNTNIVVNGTFDEDTHGWTYTTEASNHGLADNKQGDFTGKFWENWNGNAFTGNMSQLNPSAMPAGNYVLRIAAFGNNASDGKLVVFAGDAEIQVLNDIPTYYYVHFTLNNIKNAETFEYGLKAKTDNNSNWVGIDNVSIYYLNGMDDFYATTEDYTALESALSAVRDKVFGFEAGEYAPYNNVEVAKAIAHANTINPTVKNIAADVRAATNTIKNAVWVANETEVNAVYDGTFAKATNDGAPAGWTMSNNTLGGDFHSRAFVNNDRLTEFNDTKSGLFLRFDGTNSNRGSQYFYGQTEGYTMPLKAETVYYVSVDAKNWGDQVNKPLRLNVTGPSGFISNQDLTLTSDGNENTDEPQHFLIVFTTTTAGNYQISFQCPGADTNAHNALISNVELKKAATANMTITDANWGTFCAPFDVTIPEGVKAYTAAADGNSVTFTEVTTTIPAGTPVVVYSAAAVNKEFNGKATKTEETCTSGALVGVYAAKSGIAAEAGHTNYVLQNNSNVVGFYKATSAISLKANRCYMTLATSAGAKDCIGLDGVITGINNILNPTKKSVEGIYDLNGRKLAAPQKGINIINGVKVIVK